MSHVALDWLPVPADSRALLRELRAGTAPAGLDAFAQAARHDLDFIQTGRLDHAWQERRAAAGVEASRTLKLAILSSSTTAHLHAGIRVGALRRRLDVEIYQCEYGQFRQELLDPGSALHAFAPDVALVALDAHHLVSSARLEAEGATADAAAARVIAELSGLWRLIRDRLRTPILQQAALPVDPELMGENEHRLAASPAWFLDSFNHALRASASQEGVHLVAVDRHARRHGLLNWHDPAMWHRAKQEIALHAAPFFGDLVGRLLGALRGVSSKVLVLDLDNTVWGGVIGDDGLSGIVLGQGSAAGEAFAAFQRYALMLGQRGVILAVCSKNDEAVAMQAFAEHPEMVLRAPHIASFVANWDDKASNLRRIARELNVGLDSLVFVDDNPFERNLVRRELPIVAVPEVPEDPALVPLRLADAGYFESLDVTGDDRARLQQYQANRQREAMAAEATDLDSYLADLEMRLRWKRFDEIDLARTVQLVNKTNQFNLTTRRIDDEEARAVMNDPDSFGLTFRLVDRYGDNGLIAVVICRREGTAFRIDNWLMSCRVLGRGVEQATLAAVAAEAARAGGDALIGLFAPSAKNGMVREHYDRLGFIRVEADGADDAQAVRYALPLDAVAVDHPAITLQEA
ncbi:HAD-IIIC family phosphatase [Rhizosaccharibacter radicis]|uniref:HAD-IIIC family phosphatase n=1 Tax=Rhizosaccharibacter radicis TaxID=2782605 RepID=A0ABT1W0Q6_9PROT|nr:HAD-IIIC family phosphatase [Acetobacteraceae bacterium KSS12]